MMSAKEALVGLVLGITVPVVALLAYQTAPELMSAARQIIIIAPPPVMPTSCEVTAIRCVPSEYATIQLCANAAVAGDTCLVAPGTYDERVTAINAGTSNARITYRATTDCVSNNGATIASNCAKVRAWFVNADDYITIQGFEITSVGMSAEVNRPVYFFGTDHGWLLNNYIHDTGTNAFPCAVTGSSTFTVFRGNNIQGCGVQSVVAGTVLGPYNIQEGVNDTISISVQGGATQTVTLTPGAARTITQIGTEVNAQTTGATGSGVGQPTTQVLIQSDTIGPLSSLELLAVANDAYTTLGMTVGLGTLMGRQPAIAGSGDADDWLIEYNVLSYTGDYVAPGTGDKLVVRNNTVGPSHRYTDAHLDILQPGLFTKVLIEETFSIDNAANDSHVYYNTTNGADHHILRFNSLCRSRGAVAQTTGNFLYFYNNTFYDNYAIFGGVDAAQLNVGNTSTDNLSRNNIWFKSRAPGAQVYIFSGTGAMDRDYDLWWEVGDPAQTNDVNADPLVTDGANCDFTLQALSPAIDEGGPLTTVAAADTGSGTSLVVTDAKPFQDGWAGVTPDTIAVGTAGNTAQIVSIDYDTHTITLASGISRSDADAVWLYANSRGTRVLYGTAPDIGARERVQ